MKNIIDAIKAKKANNKLIDTNFAIIASKGLDYVKDVTYHSKPFTISATAVCRDSTIVIFDIPPE